MSTGYVYLIYQLILIKGDMWGTSETKGTAIGVVCLWERLSAAKIALVVGEGDTPKKLNKTGQSKIKVAGLRPRTAPDFLFKRHKKSAKTGLPCGRHDELGDFIAGRLLVAGQQPTLLA